MCEGIRGEEGGNVSHDIAKNLSRNRSTDRKTLPKIKTKVCGAAAVFSMGKAATCTAVQGKKTSYSYVSGRIETISIAWFAYISFAVFIASKFQLF